MKDWFEEHLIGVIIGTLIALVLALIGWMVYLKISAPHEGVIHAKQYNPAYTSTSCSTVNKTTICTPEYHPPSWEFDLYKTQDDHGWRDVDQVTFHQYKVGDYYSDGDR